MSHGCPSRHTRTSPDVGICDARLLVMSHALMTEIPSGGAGEDNSSFPRSDTGSALFVVYVMFAPSILSDTVIPSTAV